MPKNKRPQPKEKSTELRIAIYVRVSSKRQAEEGDSLEAQEKFAKRYIEERAAMNGWKVTEVRCYFDKGKSGKNMKRPELARLQQDIAAGLVNRVVTFKLDRITRSMADFVQLWAFFQQHGVDVVSIRENFDTTSPSGTAMVRILIVFAELEREMNSERTKQTIKSRTEEGKWGGGFAFGYVKDPATDKLVIHPADSKVVKEHFFDALENEGSGRFFVACNASGFSGRSAAPSRRMPAVRSVTMNYLHVP